MQQLISTSQVLSYLVLTINLSDRGNCCYYYYFTYAQPRAKSFIIFPWSCDYYMAELAFKTPQEYLAIEPLIHLCVSDVTSLSNAKENMARNLSFSRILVFKYSQDCCNHLKRSIDSVLLDACCLYLLGKSKDSGLFLCHC